jgi:hypothetical protein
MDDPKPERMDAVCEKHGVTLEATLVRKPIDRNAKSDDWQKSAYHFSCIIRRGDQSLTTDYFMGHAHETIPAWIKRQYDNPRSSYDLEQRAKHAQPIPPKVADVVSALVRDSSACDMPFDDWCDEYGYSNDSIKARDTYDQCQRLGSKIRRLLASAIKEFQQAEW